MKKYKDINELITFLEIEKNDIKERIKALKTAHITNALSLTPEEAQQFWPLYNANEKKLEGIRKTERQERLKVMNGGFENLSDSDAMAMLDKFMDLKQQELDLHRAFQKQLKGVLPPLKIIKLFRAEEAFKQKLLEQFKERRRRN